MKKIGFAKTFTAVLVPFVSAVLTLASCVSTEPVEAAERDIVAGGLSLLEAIELVAERLAVDIPAGDSVAVVAFESENDGLSRFIMDELTGALNDRRILVMTRQRLELELVRREMHFGMTGYVSDDTAQSIGNVVGVGIVVTGHLRNIGVSHRFTANAIQVETARHVSIPRFDVRNDEDMRRMIAALGGQPIPVPVASVPAPGTAAPQPVAGTGAPAPQVAAGTEGQAAPQAPAQDLPAITAVPISGTGAIIAAGVNHTIAVRADGTLWAWGDHGHGRTGFGIVSGHISTPSRVDTATNWTSVSAGASHSVAIRSDGSLWAWGNNSQGRLGDGTTANRNTPVRIGTATNWASASAGESHTVAIRSDGTLWAWGRNANGQLGDGTTSNRNTPVRIGAATNWAYVSAGHSHTLGLRTDGTLWAWGSNQQGQLGDGTTTGRNSPVQIQSGMTWASVSAGGIAGASHSVAIRSDGSLWGWGHSAWGQRGDGTTTNRNTPVRIGMATNWISVAAGGSHTIAIRSNGTLWAWGRNANGQLGDGTSTNRNTPMQIGTATNWASVSAGDRHTIAARSDGTFWVWGLTEHGRLGDGISEGRNRINPLQIAMQ